MGDVGSILLGFVFSGMVICWAGSFSEFILLIGFMLPFYADSLVTLIERLLAGDSLKRPHRRHLYQVLANEAGIAHCRVTVGYCITQLLIGVVLWRVVNPGWEWRMGMLLSFFVVFIVISRTVKCYYHQTRI